MRSRTTEVYRLRARLGVGFAALALVAILILCNVAGATSAHDVQSGTLTTSSDPGAIIGGGGSFSYSTPGATFQTSISGPGVQNEVDVTMRSGSSFWFLNFAAPPGQLLAPGTYTGAVRATSRAPDQPGLDISANGRGCNTLTGNFTVLDVVYGPFDYVQSLHVTFEQHCEGQVPALRGELVLSNPPAPDDSVQVTIDGNGGVTRAGVMSVHGTITCNGPFDPNASNIQLTGSEPSKEGDITGSGGALIPPNCSSTPTTWTGAIALNDRKHPFVKGTATVTAHARVYNTFYEAFVYADATATVALKET